MICYHTLGVLKEQTSPQEALQQYIDALDILDEQTKPPACLRSSLLHSVGRIHYHRQDYRLAVKYLKRSIEYKKGYSTSYDEGTAQSLYLLGCSEYYLGDLSSSLKSLESASQIFARTHGKKSLFMLNNFIALAKTSARQDKMKSAISYQSKAMTLWNAMRNPTVRSKDTYMSFGELFVELGNFDKASEFFEDALLLQSTEADITFSSALNMNLAIVNSKRGNVAVSRNYADRALQLYKESYSDSSLEYANALEKIGDIECNFHDLSRAIEYYNKALLILQDRNDTENRVRLLLIIGFRHQDAGNLEDGLQCFRQLLESEISPDLQSENVAFQAKQGLASSLFLLEDYDNALKLFMSILKDNMDLECLSSSELVSIHRCIGLMYLKMDKTRQAYHHFILSISSYEKYCSTGTKSQSCSENAINNVLDVYENLLSLADLELEWKGNVSSIYDGYANALTKAGDFKTAIKIFMQILSDQESHNNSDLAIAATLYNLGNCSRILGQPANTVMFFEHSLDILTRVYGENALEIADTLYSLSKAHAINFDFLRALPLCQKALRLKMSDPTVDTAKTGEILRTLGYMLLSSGEVDASWEALTEALSIQRRHFNKDEISLTYFFVGKAFIYKGRYEEGLGFLKQVNTHSQKYSEALLEIGHVHEIRGEIDTAREYYTRCFVLVEEELAMSFGSKLFLDEGENNTSTALQVSVLKESIDVEAKKSQEVFRFTNSLKIYGMLFQAAGRYEEALACFDFYLDVYPRDADVSYEKGYSLYKLARYPSASSSLHRALQIFRQIFGNIFNKQLSDTLKLLGECENNRGHHDEALKFFDEAKRDWSKVERNKQQHTESQNHEQQKFLLNVGKMHQKKKEYVVALQNFEACVKIAQNLETESGLHGESVFSVGHLYFESGNYLRAIINYQHAFEIFHDENIKMLNVLSMVRLVLWFRHHVKPLELYFSTNYTCIR